MNPSLTAAVRRLTEAHGIAVKCSIPPDTHPGPARLCGACASGLMYEARQVAKAAAEPDPLRTALETILRKTETYQLQDRGRDGLVDIARVAHAALGHER